MKRFLCLFFYGIFFFTTAHSQTWDSLASGVDGGEIKALYADSITNKLFVAGRFLTASEDTVYGFCLWNGTGWETLGKEDPIHYLNYDWGNSIRAITRYKGRLLISGRFFYYDPELVITWGIAEWTGQGWNVIENTAVAGFYTHQDTLYAFGTFQQIGGINASMIAKYDGKTWSAIDTTVWNGTAIMNAVHYKGELYVVGNFENHDESIENLAKWNGKQWEKVGRGMSDGGSSLRGLGVYKDRLYIGGIFRGSNNPGNGIAAWDGTS